MQKQRYRGTKNTPRIIWKYNKKEWRETDMRQKQI